MIGLILGGLLLLMLTACATGPRQYLDASHKPQADQQRDAVECAAIASQAAQGAGGFWTDASLRNAAYMQAREQYLARGACGESGRLAAPLLLSPHGNVSATLSHRPEIQGSTGSTMRGPSQ